MLQRTRAGGGVACAQIAVHAAAHTHRRGSRVRAGDGAVCKQVMVMVLHALHVVLRVHRE